MYSKFHRLYCSLCKIAFVHLALITAEESYQVLEKVQIFQGMNDLLETTFALVIGHSLTISVWMFHGCILRFYHPRL